MDSTPRSQPSQADIISPGKRLQLFEEYRLIERSEDEINGAWKGAHLLLFFLAFVFGSFCTFCFHMLMYLFDEKCVLFPKLMSLTRLKHNIIYEFIPSNKDGTDLPVDFLSTQWVEKSTCLLPTYVPLVSGIFGLVWTTMFLMCSTGSRTLTGLQRPWRVLPPVFVFSLAMGCLCVHSSVTTHRGLEELCRKLGEITGSPTCTYTVNVATLTYERRIRGVYQATRLTIVSAWLHTACWLLSALLTVVRVLLAVDFLLVRVSVELHGEIDKILEKNEVQLRSVSPQTWINTESEYASVDISTRSISGVEDRGDLLFLSNLKSESSEPSLVPDEWKRIARNEAMKRVPKNKAFIVKWVYDLVDRLKLPDHIDAHAQVKERTASTVSACTDPLSIIPRQFGKETFSLVHDENYDADVRPPTRVDSIIFHQAKIKKGDSSQIADESSPKASTSKPPDQEHVSKPKRPPIGKVHAKKRKPILKTAVGVQTYKGKDSKQGLHVQIAEKEIIEIKDDWVSSEDEKETTEKENVIEVDKETQTKEKLD